MLTTIVVSNQSKLNKRLELARYKCKCGSETVTQASMHDPFCSACGSTDTKKVEISSDMRYPEYSDEELATIKCSGCSSNLIMPIEVAHAVCDEGIGKIHCPACASEMVFKQPVIASEFEDLEDWDEGDPDIVNDNSEDDEELEQASEDETHSPDEVPDELPQDDGEELTGYLNTPLYNVIEPSAPKCIRSGNALYIMCGPHCLGMKDLASDEIDNYDVYEQALNTAFETNTVESVLKQGNFTPSMLSIPNTKIIKDHVSQKREQLETEYGEKIKQLHEGLSNAYSLAACGINRGFFQQENPLVSMLASRICQATSCDNAVAAKIVADAIQEAGDDYIKVLSTTADEIAQMSPEVRNELTKTVMSVQPRSAVASLSDDLSDRLSQPMRSSTVESSSIKQQPDSVVRKLASGSKLFTR